MFLRSVQLILIIVAGIVCVILGYKLFLYGIDKGRNKLRFKSEIFRLIFSGSAPGLFFMVLGGLLVIFSLYSVGLSSEILKLSSALSDISQPPSAASSADTDIPDTTYYTEVLSEASFVPVTKQPPPPANRNLVKPKNSRQIKRSLKTDNSITKASKSIYRSQQELSYVINKHNKAIEYCYKKEVKSNPSLKGDMDVEFVIDYKGRVKSVRIVRSSMYSKTIEKCISSRIRGWRFKEIDPNDGDVKVRQKYIFG
jgi:TonB family protein